MPNDQRSNIPDDSGWVEPASHALINRGFELVESDLTQGHETSHLLVALRPQPSLKHYDPETIDYWTTESGRGRAARLERETRLPIVGEYAWGHIALTDRISVANEFLSFGGTLRAQMTSDAVVLIDFSSNAPILRWSGHSQLSDPLASELGSFFARTRVPIDFVPGAESLVAKAGPQTLYCVFIQSVRERLAQARTMRDANRWLTDWSARESQRMESTYKDSWQAAAEMRRQLSAIEAIARE